ncbi:MAG: hypothetical protein NDJ94_04850 [Vicinamibacteria bacterium]|jgi:hypothetical protein|nr:hypothetical protein [Vicinamibacteria bacterium]
MVPAAAQALLARLVDYAGLFPPAALGMAEAVAEYATQRTSGESWMLGRFVVPAARLAELTAACTSLSTVAGAPSEADPWELSVLAGADLVADLAAVAALPPWLKLDAVEARAAGAAEVDAVLAAWSSARVPVYVELPLGGDLDAALIALKRGGGRAKVRTGGLTAEAIPRPEDLARFLRACAAHGVAHKATAGLHHPLRSERPLTYAPDAPVGVMHGFVNVFAAAALARTGAPEADLLSVLHEAAEDAFVFEGDALRVGEHRLDAATLAASRAEFALGFGSCSFREPVADLRALGVLPRVVPA